MIMPSSKKILKCVALASLGLNVSNLLGVAAFSSRAISQKSFRIAPHTTSQLPVAGEMQLVNRNTRLFAVDNDDPNPGGLNQWEDENDRKKSFNEIGFFDQVREWFASDEGKEDVKTYTTSLAVALLLRLLIIEPRYIPSLSMYPTFEVGDQLAVEKVTKRIRPFSRNEVVVFNPPQAFREIVGDSSRKAKEALIKRIVAVEGDTVEVKGGKLYVNGVMQDEPFTAEDAAYEFGPVLVPPGDVLVLGDNRNHSLDGHIWGFLPAENVIGRAVFVYWPPWRVGTNGMY
mmetsp:Transcript_12522/g.25527  ORF Transcript_12522/g.25527 Transcript_12522/m.25527 type:complete len:287 (+) Transcript_12522:2-862(+)